MAPQWFIFMMYSIPILGILFGLVLAIRTFMFAEQHQQELDGVVPEHHPFLLMKRIVQRRIVQRSASALPQVPGYVAQALTPPASKHR